MKNNTNFLNLDAHIRKLHDSMSGIRISYRPGYDQDGPCIGIRGAMTSKHSDSIIIDDVVWLVAGDIYTKCTNNQIRSMVQMAHANPAGLMARMRAQALVAGCMVNVTLGYYSVAELDCCNDELGFAVLGKNN